MPGGARNHERADAAGRCLKQALVGLVEKRRVDFPSTAPRTVEDQFEALSQVQPAGLRLGAVTCRHRAVLLDDRHDVAAKVEGPAPVGGRNHLVRRFSHREAVEVRQRLLAILVAADAHAGFPGADPRPGQLRLDGHAVRVERLEADDRIGGHLDVETAVRLGRGVADDPLLLEVIILTTHLNMLSRSPLQETTHKTFLHSIHKPVPPFLLS